MDEHKYLIRDDWKWIARAAKVTRIIFYPIILIWHLFDPEVEL